ncbi:MAG: aldo/keto reductase [Candidatus Omnitrophota bacterium]|jgi:aryl-alcohol dehydrogenase-like predicted oxidoreductase
MKTRRLGRTGLEVTEIGFGAWAIGGTGYGPTRDEESLAALETAWQRGVNFFDTADTYGCGRSESLVGRFLRGKPRHQIFIATKAGWDFYHAGGTRKNFHPSYVRFACEESLKRLGIDSIDLYQLHNPSLDILRAGESVGALEALKREGKIRFIGVSAHTEEEAEAAIADGRVDALQLVFNLLDQQMGAKVFDLAFRSGIGIIVREPLAYGFLSGKYKPGHAFHKDDHRRRFTREVLETNLKKIEILKRIMTTERLPMAQAALEYILQFPQVATVIPGAKTAAQVTENTEASLRPRLRSEEAYHLRDLYSREPIFREHVF